MKLSSSVPTVVEVDLPEKDLDKEAKAIGTSLFVGMIIFLVIAIVFSALSMKGIHQWGCKYNWNAFSLFFMSIANSFLWGIPGLVGMYQMRNVRFTEDATDKSD